MQLSFQNLVCDLMLYVSRKNVQLSFQDYPPIDTYIAIKLDKRYGSITAVS
jgi:hypothetical protein